MNKINITLEYTKDLTVLYAEDDIELSVQTEKLFNMLFKKVITTTNGQEALEKYKNEHFDIVITDIEMPLMGGVELTSEIKGINSDQAIIIISAYDNSEYLLDFINLNVKQFVQKPININDMLKVLLDVSKNIVNSILVEDYRKELEKNNTTLKEKNNELQSLVRILDSKIIQIAKENQNSSKNVTLENISFSKKNIIELKNLEIDISGAAVLISLSKNLKLSNIQVLGELFLSYTKVISSNQSYDELSDKIATLGQILNHAPENFIKKVEDISILLESFIYVLRMWRKNLEEGANEKAFELHTSMINDINTIISIINGTEDEIESEIEFF